MNDGKIVVVEDETAIRRVIVLALKGAGYTDVVEVGNGREAAELIAREVPTLVLLDVMLPGLDGVEVCRRMRANRETAAVPIIMLTAKSEEHDIVAGLDAGANDYVTKPFSREVLLARIRAVLRRPELEKMSVLVLDGLVIDDSAHGVAIDGVPLELTIGEYKILELLVRNKNRVFTRAHIIDRIYDGEKVTTDRAIDVQMVSLRRKLGEWARHVETIRGVGYRVG